MKNTDSKTLNHLIPFVPLPATLVGVYTMTFFDAPVHMWAVNLFFVSLGIFITFLFYNKPIRLNNINPITVTVISIVLLLFTFYGNGLMNVHRWINVYLFQINVGLIVSPLILIQLSRISQSIVAVTLSVITILIFLLQPDASLVTAFSVSAIVLLYTKHRVKRIYIPFLIFALSAIIYTWSNIDQLEPVAYVENILALAREISPGLFLVSLSSLFLLTVPFFINDAKKDVLSVSLGLYFLVLLLVPFVAHFPVMLTGYGVSPIIGYFIGLNSVKLLPVDLEKSPTLSGRPW